MLLFGVLPIVGCGPTGRLDAVSPGAISNQTVYPITVYGEALTSGLRLVLDGHPPIPTVLVDAKHLTAQLPAGLGPSDGDGLTSLVGRLQDAQGRTLAGEVTLEVVDDLRYPVPQALTVGPRGQRAFVALFAV